ncbi:MAG: BolA family protein [Pseudomonadota bacterium]
MQPQQLQSLLVEELADCEVQVQGEGSHYNIVVVGEMFAGMRPVQKQQAVYKVLNPYIADGSIHAVNIRTFTPAEWQAHSA